MVKFTKTTEVELDWVEVSGDISAYKKTTSINGVFEKTEEGIASTVELENTTNGDFEESKWLLFPSKEARDFCLNNALFLENTRKMYSLALENPYTSIKNSDNVLEFELLKVNPTNYLVFSIDEQPIQQMLDFDYMQTLDEKHYNLEESLNILTARSDVFPSKNGVAIDGKLEISKIPYYNKEEDNEEQIEFVWKPSKEDMKLFFELSANTVSSKKRLALKEIFKLVEKDF